MVRIATYSLQILYLEIMTKSSFNDPQTATKRIKTVVHVSAILGVVSELLTMNTKNKAM
jgi:hypothetical protein